MDSCGSWVNSTRLTGCRGAEILARDALKIFAGRYADINGSCGVGSNASSKRLSQNRARADAPRRTGASRKASKGVSKEDTTCEPDDEAPVRRKQMPVSCFEIVSKWSDRTHMRV